VTLLFRPIAWNELTDGGCSYIGVNACDLDTQCSARILSVEALSQAEFATEARYALHEAGWTEAFERLEKLLASTS
jgi:hypothetical protein